MTLATPCRYLSNRPRFIKENCLRKLMRPILDHPLGLYVFWVSVYTNRLVYEDSSLFLTRYLLAEVSKQRGILPAWCQLTATSLRYQLMFSKSASEQLYYAPSAYITVCPLALLQVHICCRMNRQHAGTSNDDSSWRNWPLAHDRAMENEESRSLLLKNVVPAICCLDPNSPLTSVVNALLATAALCFSPKAVMSPVSFNKYSRQS